MRYPRLSKEAVIRSLLAGLSVAFGVDFVIGALFWFLGTNSLALVLGVLFGALIVTTAAAGAIFYFTKFKPTVKGNARRIDGLGLEERVITMIDYASDDSLIAKLQREDAIKALKDVDEKSLKLIITKKMIISLAVSAALGLTMVILASLNAVGLLRSFKEILDDALPDEPPVYIPISYIVEEGGYIEGEMEQLVLLGENAEPVTAIPEDGYSFEGWDDGYKKPTRNDTDIDHPLILTAIFVPLEDDGDGGDDGQNGDDGQSPGEQEGDSGSPGESDQPGDQEGEDSDQIGQGAGKYNKVNQIIDGSTYYREFLEEYKDTIMELLKKRTEELTEEEKAIIEAYINIV